MKMEDEELAMRASRDLCSGASSLLVGFTP